MSRIREHQNADPDLTLGGRGAAALASLLFSVPLMGLLWLLFNRWIAPVADGVLPLAWLGGAIVGFAALSFAWPRVGPSVFGWSCRLLMGMGRWLW